MLSSEIRERASYIEAVVSNTLDTISSNQTVRDHLGRLAPDYIQYLEQLFIPNFRHGVVHIPPEYQDVKATPVVALKPGEGLQPGPSLRAMNSIQTERLRAVIRSWDPIGGETAVLQCEQSIHKGLRQSDCSYVLADDTKLGGTLFAVGMVAELPYKSFSNSGKDRFRRFLARPLIGLIMRNDPPSDIKPQTTLVHEIKHTIQHNRWPVLPGDEARYRDLKWRRELEACHAGASFESGVYASAHPVYGGNEAAFNSNTVIDRIRREHQIGSDAFRPHPVLKNALQQAGLDVLT